MVSLMPSSERCRMLRKTGALREGHFGIRRNTARTLDALGVRYYDTARVLAVGLSRLFRD